MSNGKKIITNDELKAHAKKDDLYILLHGKGKFPQRLFLWSEQPLIRVFVQSTPCQSSLMRYEQLSVAVHFFSY